MKKIAIITYHAAHNYGAALQAYALQETVRELGHECFIVDYRPPFMEGLRGRPTLREVRSLKALAKYVMFATYLKAGAEKQAAKFEQFINEQMHLSGLYRTLDDLRQRPPDADAFICGSDQVWNPRIMGMDLAYLLDFVPDGRKRIAYAGSFGRTEMQEDVASVFRDHLSRFSAISVRESSGCEIVRQLASRDPQWVLDPTLLRTQEQWSQIATPRPVEEPYILCYLIREIPEVIAIARHWQKETGYSIVQVGGSPRPRRDRRDIHRIRDAGPREYLALFQNASMVIAMSFHGTAFSVIYRKPFCSMLHPTQTELNSRATSLLELLKLASRLYYPGKSKEFPSIEISYEEAEPILDSARIDSFRFLNEAISD